MNPDIFDPDTEVSGHAMLALIECMVAKDIIPILEKHGIDRRTLHVEDWYPLQRWLNVFDDILAVQGFQSTLNLVDIGRTYVNTAYLPEDIDTLEDALIAINDTYQLNHRNGYAGEMSIIIMGPGHIQVVDHTPYPEDFSYGMIYGVAQRYRPEGVRLIVRHDDEQPCRKRGDDSCTFDISWE